MEIINVFMMSIMCLEWKITFWAWENSLIKTMKSQLKDCTCLMRYRWNNVIAKVPMARNSLLIKHSSWCHFMF